MKTIVDNTFFFVLDFHLLPLPPCFFTGDGDRDVDVEVDSDEDSELKAVEESDESSDEDNTSYSLFLIEFSLPVHSRGGTSLLMFSSFIMITMILPVTHDWMFYF